MQDKRQLKIMATNWGYEGSITEFCAAVKKEGFDGIEVDWINDEKRQQVLFKALEKYGLDVGFLCEGHGKNENGHLESFSENVQAAATNMQQRPLYINCHSGKDYFTEEDGLKFIDAATRISGKTGIPVYHETHRGRLMYSAPVTKQYLQKRPELLLNADLSHWCNVHESFLEDQEETMELALARTGHIHARIGHPQGPQVNDPRAPEWKKAVDKHFEWWDKIIEHKLNRRENIITLLAEFGPPDYLQVLPFTREPVASQWELNVYMLKVLRARYSPLLCDYDNQ